MVYQGPSQGCGSCKRRRKKCDETRPSCMRCVKGNRICGGYEQSASSIFRSYGPQNVDQRPPLQSMARKCTLPPRVPIPGTDVLPVDIGSPEIELSLRNAYPVRAFIYDFCVVSSNKDLSRGFLTGVETMFHRLGVESNLAKACYAVSSATHGKSLQRPNLTHLARGIYQELLGRLSRAIENSGTVNTAESEVVAMLLGIYQMTVANETDYGHHEHHAKGLAALLKIGHSPLDLLGTFASRRGSSRNSPLHLSGFFLMQPVNDRSECLDELLLDFSMLWREHESFQRPEEFGGLREMAKALYLRFTKWQESRAAEVRPTSIGNIQGNRCSLGIPVGHWPGKIDTYFDFCVAGVWNIFRAAQLLLITLVMRLFDPAADTGPCVDLIQEANRIAEDMIASIPYHLTDDLHAFVRDLATGTEIREPGRTLGGLLLMHPLYVASNMPLLPNSMRDYLRRCLAWIASRMGIGQAALFATNSDLDKEYAASGCMIIWSGFVL